MNNPLKKNKQSEADYEEPIGEQVEQELQQENEQVLAEAEDIYSQLDASAEFDFENAAWPDEKEIAQVLPELSHSWEKDRVFEGLFMGMKPNAYVNKEGVLVTVTVVSLMQKDKRVKSGVAAYQIKNFLTENNVPIGTYVAFEKINEISLGGGRKMGEYVIRYDRKKLKIRNKLLTADQYNTVGLKLEQAEVARHKMLPY